jgi:hypothetical protein
MMKSGSATLMDRSFQLVLNCLDTEQAPFSTETFWGGVPDELPVLPVCNDERTKQENHTWLPDIPLPRVPPYLQ